MSAKHQATLKGKFWEDRKIEHSIIFDSEFEFGGYEEAREHLLELGYQTAVMNDNVPVGFVHGDEYVCTWKNLSEEEKSQLDGVILPDTDYRYDQALVLFFNPPKY
jgi:hypothetical protein